MNVRLWYFDACWNSMVAKAGHIKNTRSPRLWKVCRVNCCSGKSIEFSNVPHYTDTLKSGKKKKKATQNYHGDFKNSAARFIKNNFFIFVSHIHISSYYQRTGLSHLDLFYSRFPNNAGTANSGCYLEKIISFCNMWDYSREHLIPLSVVTLLTTSQALGWGCSAPIPPTSPAPSQAPFAPSSPLPPTPGCSPTRHISSLALLCNSLGVSSSFYLPNSSEVVFSSQYLSPFSELCVFFLLVVQGTLLLNSLIPPEDGRKTWSLGIKANSENVPFLFFWWWTLKTALTNLLFSVKS